MHTDKEVYKPFLSTITAKQWRRIGLRRRAGVAVPLFSVYSKNSVGIGELPDLSILVDWCAKTGLSVIQLLPVNDVGSYYGPYDTQSSFALDPMYLAPDRLVGVDAGRFTKDLDELKERFPTNGTRVNYQIKAEKLAHLRRIFEHGVSAGDAEAIDRFQHAQKNWLPDYVLFKAIKAAHNGARWEEWPEELNRRDPAALEAFGRAHERDMRFYTWLQWQLFEQLTAAKAYAHEKHVLLMGDLPFLVSRDSADVWSHQDYFKLEQSSGAPPDMYFALGQRWGMPTYRWDVIREHRHDYLLEKLRYAEHFYDAFRIDHVVGMFRLWTIANSEAMEHHGLHGVFDPYDETVWEARGRALLSLMATHTRMLPCAEDLGTVPECSYRVLSEYGIPGTDVQRWSKVWNGTCGFKSPESYRTNSVSTLSTHDSSTFSGWWMYEAGTVDAELFERKCRERGIAFEHIDGRLFDHERSLHGRLRWRDDVKSEHELIHILERRPDEVGDLIGLYKESYGEKAAFWRYVGMDGPMDEQSSPALMRKTLDKINQTASVFSIQLLQDWLSLGATLSSDPWETRINFPGTLTAKNWSYRFPLSLEALNRLECNEDIRTIVSAAGRI